MKRIIKLRKYYPLLVASIVVTWCSFAYAQDEGEGGAIVSMWETIETGGIIGYTIILFSLVAAALIFEHFMSIRRKTLLPVEFIEKIEEQLNTKQYADAQEECENNKSFIAAVVSVGLGHIGSMFGFFDMQNAMQEVAEREVGRLYRKLEYLSFIAVSAPMLGLLGTVTGMIGAFDTISRTEGAAKPSQLAGDISEALITTCMGLIVAIPTTFFVSFFRNRIDAYVSEAESIVEKLMGRFRQQSGK